MSSFAGELAEIIECQTALMFTEEPPSAAPFGPVYECGGRGLNTSLSVSCFGFFSFLSPLSVLELLSHLPASAVMLKRFMFLPSPRHVPSRR